MLEIIDKHLFRNYALIKMVKCKILASRYNIEATDSLLKILIQSYGGFGS